MHFAIYFVYFSSCKSTPPSGSWKHPHKYRRQVKTFIFQGLPCLLQDVIKISTVYKFHKGHIAAKLHWQFYGMKLSQRLALRRLKASQFSFVILCQSRLLSLTYIAQFKLVISLFLPFRSYYFKGKQQLLQGHSMVMGVTFVLQQQRLKL